MYSALAQSPALASAVRTALAFIVLLVPTALMGATLPLAVRAARGLFTSSRADARTMGVLYGVNTAGAIIGCLLSGFLLIGRLGLSETITAAAACNLTAGALALLLSRPAARAAGSRGCRPWHL
ncbi:MAG TPA: spermidine synthase, partial [Chloroflexota bacterium]|nr:spermidine synthase [Chloroflexota bacterium]